MKAKDGFLVIGLTALFLLSAAFALTSVKGNGPAVNETRQLAHYEKLNVQIASKVNLYQSSEYKIVIEAQQRILDILKTEIKNNELIIKFDELKFEANHQDLITINVFTPMINSLKVLGSADILNKTPFNSDNLDISISGSGNVRINTLMANKVDVNIAGSGTVALSGSCDEQTLLVMGSGEIQNTQLTCNSTKVEINGSGTANVMSIDYLEAIIIGSGHVYYKGDPITECSIAGSGKLHSI